MDVCNYYGTLVHELNFTEMAHLASMVFDWSYSKLRRARGKHLENI